MGGIPIWEEDGLETVQSSAILRMLGIRLGYYTDKPQTAYEIDSIIDFIEGVIEHHSHWMLPKLRGPKQWDESQTTEYIAKVWAAVIPVIEARFEKSSTKFVAGTTGPTIADFKICQLPFAGTDLNPHSEYPADARAQIDALFNAAPKYKAFLMMMKETVLADYIATAEPRIARAAFQSSIISSDYSHTIKIF